MGPHDAEGFSVAFRDSPRANDALGPRPGWDPYEVWQTRVKGPATVNQKRQNEPLQWRMRLALRGWRLRTSLNA